MKLVRILERRWGVIGKRMTSIATASSGGATAAMLAAVLIPAAPALAIVGIGLVGPLVSKYVASAIDSFMERRTSASERSTM
jgi:xanthosine utilization system XapX-like protein